uniref:Putative membrane protein n=1 Tax=Culex tarsalis TaxID=7177 RepID=A0A1Q3G590_CULTA
MASNCFNYIPSVEEYFAAYTTTLIVLLAVLAVFLLLVSLLYVQIVKHLVEQYEPRCRKALIFSNGIYLVIVALCIVALTVPVASEKMELVSLIIFSWSVLALFILHSKVQRHVSKRT